MVRCIFAVAALAAAAGVSAAADAKAVQGAIAKAIARLRADQEKDTGRWPYDGNDKNDKRALGSTALAALALYENGVPPGDPAVGKALGFVRSKLADNDDTYCVALGTLLLARVGQPRDRELLKDAAARLELAQLDTGAWNYTTPKRGRDKARKKAETEGLGDMSVTQFAAMALWQAQRARAIDATKAFEKLRARLAWGQVENGGWNYHSLPDVGGDSHTMTTASLYMWLVGSAAEIRRGRANKNLDILKPNTSDKIYALLQAAAQKHKTDQAKTAQAKAEGTKPGEAKYEYPTTTPPELNLRTPSPLVGDPFLQKAIKRAGEWNEAIGGNPGAGHYYYYLWSAQRLGMLLGVATLGKNDWYDVGAAALVKAQHADGSFGITAAEAEKSHVKPGPDTAFALLFLRKTNLGSDVGKLLNPDPSTPFQVVATGKKHKTFAEAVADAAPGGTIEIAGDGPFAAHGLVLDKSLTVRAAPGYEPAFRYEIPKDQGGLRIDVRAKPEHQQLFAVKPAPKPEAKPEGLKFECVRFQADAAVAGPIPLAVFRGTGQMLQFLNCSFTFTAESRQGEDKAAAVEMTDPERVFFRNCQLGGFSPCVRIVATATGAGRGARFAARDCLFYAPVVLEAKGDGKVVGLLCECTVFADQVFRLGELSGPFSCTAEHALFKATELFAELGAGERAWAGHKNLFEAAKWFAKGPAAAVRVREFADWQRYWEGADAHSASGAAPFFVSRQSVSSVKHDLNAKDWALDQTKARRSLRKLGLDEQLGAGDFYVGPGDGFLQFREVGDYENWVKLDLPSKRVKASVE